MVLMAYLAGLVTTPAALAGVVLGHAWWARLRRSEGASEAPVMLTMVKPFPAPPSAQAVHVQNRVSFASRPGPHRAVRGRLRRTLDE